MASNVFTTLLLILGLLGLVNASYLVWKRYKKQQIVCPLNHDCNAVIGSKWGSILGIKNEVLGVGYFIIFLVIAYLSATSEEVLYQKVLLILSTLSMIYTAFLFYIQKFVLKQYCFYCLISALINSLIFIIQLFIS